VGALATIEGQAIPRVVEGIMNQLATREAEIRGYVNEAAEELEAIPPRNDRGRSPEPAGNHD
jgi:hypothetical protein